MANRVYRAPFQYWIVSTLVTAALISIPVFLLISIPGFPHFGDITRQWRRYYAGHMPQAVILAFIWMVAVCAFAYWSWRALSRLASPPSYRGVLDDIEDLKSGKRNSFWIQLSGKRYFARYNDAVYNSLQHPSLAGATVEVKFGVGDRVVFIDVPNTSS